MSALCSTFRPWGCPKTRVDSEIMLGGFLAKGYQLVGDPAEADVIVVNTCAFIGPAKEESIDTILEPGTRHRTITAQGRWWRPSWWRAA